MKLKLLSTLALSCLLCMLTLSSQSYGQAEFAVCHLEGNGSYHLIVVANQAVVNAHLNHGDQLPVNGACPGGTSGGGDPEPGATPEPLTILLFGTGLAGVGYATRRWRKNGKSDEGEQA